VRNMHTPLSLGNNCDALDTLRLSTLFPRWMRLDPVVWLCCVVADSSEGKSRWRTLRTKFLVEKENRPSSLGPSVEVTKVSHWSLEHKMNLG
jgi:hypothetical protein